MVRVEKAAVNTNQGKASLHAVSVCRRSGRRRCCGRVFRWRQRRGSRRGWVSRPERTKFSIGAGDVSPTRNRMVAMSKTHFAAFAAFTVPANLTGILSHFPMSVCFHSDAPLGQSGCGANNPPSRLLPCHLLSKGGQRSPEKRCKLLCQKLPFKGAVTVGD